MDLKNSWNELSKGEVSTLRQKRFPADCYAELYLAIDSSGQRSMILYLPLDIISSYYSFRPRALANITIGFEYFEVNAGLVITLTNSLLNDLFDELITSIYRRIAEIRYAGEYTSTFINTYWQWVSFFDMAHDSGLTKEEVKGIMGELSFLELLLRETLIDRNEIVDSWTGIHGDDKDFILKEHAFEIKSISSSKHEIRISSEYQLEPVHAKELYLLVIKLDEDSQNGFTLKDKYQEIKNILTENGVDSLMFATIMSSKGLSDLIVKDYEHLKFSFNGYQCYHASKPGFPAILKSGLPEGLKNVNYNIELGKIKGFIHNLDFKAI
jgi:hypothetical protein